MPVTVDRKTLLAALTQELRPELFRDYAPNGLQVEGRNHIQRIVTGVTACAELIERAIEVDADAILVHHGYFWRGEPAPIVGMKAQRVKRLLTHSINLLAYHLPLDAHHLYGNNVVLGQRLGCRDICVIKDERLVKLDKRNTHLLFSGVPKTSSLAELVNDIECLTGRAAQVLSADLDRPIKRLAWCTGAAQDALVAAHLAGADAYITGEVSERTYHEVQELGIHFIAAGHHATERYGVQAIGSWLSTELDLETKYIDIVNPI